MGARRRTPLRPLARTVAAVLALAVVASTQTPPRPELALTQKFLTDLSSWQQHVEQAEGTPVDKRTRGVFPVGDGHVFTYLGLGRRANTMQALTGPHYQTAEVNAPKGHWGELSLDLLDHGTVVPLPVQSVWRTRGMSCVITEDATPRAPGGAELSLYTVNFATPPHRTLYRWVEVRNRGAQTRRLTLRATWERGVAAGTTLAADYPAKGFRAELAGSRPARAEGNTLVLDLGDVAAGDVAKVVLALRTKVADTDYGVAAPDEAATEAALTACAEHWQRRLADTARFATDDSRLTDLVEDWKVLMLVQRSEPSGAVSPMVNYRGSWVRDNNGPLLAFLRYGLFAEARAILDYVYAATIVTGRLNNHVPLDLDVSQAKALERTVDWSKLQIPNGELPAWIILQHEWYYRATWDVAFIRDRWPFLSACYRALKPDERGTFPTHGDETYLHGAFFSLFPDRTPDNCFLPADAPERRARSFDVSAAYLMVINAMGEMVEDVDRLEAGAAARQQGWNSTRKQGYDIYHIEYLQKMEAAFWLPQEKRFAPFLSPVTGEPHTAPFGPVNLRPQWIGYTYAIGEKNRENLKNTLDALWQHGSRVGMTPTCGAATGHLQGYLLYSLCDLDDKRRMDALTELVDLAGPAGEWAEIYDEEGRPVGAYDQEWPNRLRPWESGVNLDAIFFALNGIRYVCCPGWSKRDQRYKLRIPPGSRWLSMTDVRHDGHHFSIFLQEEWEKDLQSEKSGMPVRKMRFRIDHDRINPEAGGISYIDAAVNVGGTLYVRYPTLTMPLNERDVWPVDKEEMFPSHDGAGNYQPRLPASGGSYQTLFVTARRDSVSTSDRLTLDIGLPLLPQQLADLILPDGKRRFDRVVFDVGARSVNRTTFKTRAFWEAPELTQALVKFVEQGGSVIEPRFLSRYMVVGPFAAAGVDDLERAMPPEEAGRFRTGTFDLVDGQGPWHNAAASDPTLDLRQALAAGGKTPVDDKFIAYASAVLESDADRECILRLGSDDGVRVWVNGQCVLTRKALRSVRPDADEVLVRLVKGENRLLFKVYNETGGCFLVARLTTPDGAPVPGVSEK